MTTVQTVNDEAQPCTTTVHDDDAPACTATGHDGRADKHIDIATLTACSDDDRMAADRQAYLDLWETRPAGFALAPATPAAGALAGAPPLPAASTNGVEPPSTTCCNRSRDGVRPLCASSAPPRKRKAGATSRLPCPHAAEQSHDQSCTTL